eukprot:g3388.t1
MADAESSYRMRALQEQMSLVAPMVRDILKRGKRENVTVKIALRGLGLPLSFLSALDNDKEDHDIVRELYLRFQIEKTYDKDKGMDRVFEAIAKDLGGSVTVNRVKQLHRLLGACVEKTLNGAELDEFDVKVSRLQNNKDNQYVTVDGGETIMVCPHFKEHCAACGTDLRMGNQYSSQAVQSVKQTVKQKQQNAEEENEWQAFLSQLQQSSGEKWKFEAAKLFGRACAPDAKDSNCSSAGGKQLTNAKIAERLNVTEKQVKTFRQKYNAKRKKVFATESEGSAEVEDNAGTEDPAGTVNNLRAPVQRLERRPFVSSRTDISQYLREFPSQHLSNTLVSAESVEQILVQRHTDEEKYYENSLREMGGTPRVDADIVRDACFAARLTDNPLLAVMLEKIFEQRSELAAREAAKIRASDTATAYFYGVGAFFDALYVQEEPARKKQLWRKAAENFGKAILELEGNVGRRLRAVWYLFRMLRLIVHNDKLDRYLDHIRKQLAERLELKASSSSGTQTLEKRLVHLHVVLHFAKLKFESHMRSEALLGFQQAEMLLEKLLADHPDATKLVLPGGENPANRTPLVVSGGASIEIKNILQRDLRDYRCALHIVWLHLAVLYKEARDFDKSYQYFNRLEKVLNPPARGREPEQMYIGVQSAEAVVGSRQWTGDCGLPFFFENSHVAFHFEQSYIIERYGAFVALGRRQLAHLWIDHHFSWGAQYGQPKLLRAYADFLCDSTCKALEPSFRRTFDENFEEGFDRAMERLEQSIAGGEDESRIQTKEPRKVNPINDPAVAKMYFDLLAEEALRQADYAVCIRFAERKLTFLGGEWDRVACYLILRACLDMPDKEEGMKIGKEKLKTLRADYAGQMRHHEYFFVLYLENELTTCSEDNADRVLFRINKFKKQFPRMVAMCNIKQSRDFFAVYQAETAGGVGGGEGKTNAASASKKGKTALGRAIDLARRATRYSEGRLWLAALQTATALPDDLAKIALTTEDQLDLYLCVGSSGEGSGVAAAGPAVATEEDDEDAQLTVQELAEKLTQCSDAVAFQSRLAKLIDLEQRNARPEINLDGNQRLPPLVPEHYVWQNFVDSAEWAQFSKRRKCQFVDFPRRPEDQSDVAQQPAGPVAGGDRAKTTKSSKKGSDVVGSFDFDPHKRASAAVTVTEDPQAKVTAQNVDAFAASVLEAGANDRTLFDMSAFLEAGSKYFCVISDWQGLDKTRRLEYVRAIRKGFATKAQKSVGLKMDQHKMIKVKINGDHRLWTSTIFVNKFNKRLLVFGREDDHVGIERAKNAMKGNIQIERE